MALNNSNPVLTHVEQKRNIGFSSSSPRTDGSMSITISVTGELFEFVDDLKLKILHTSSSSSSSREIIPDRDLIYVDPKTENYLFLVKNKSRLPPEYLFYRGHSGTIAELLPTIDEWRQACVVSLIERDLHLLPEKPPDCPNLVVLSLQRSKRLYEIPPSFFHSMPALRFLDLSGTRVRALPSSLLSLTKLQVLLLRNCSFLFELPSEIGKLGGHLEVLDVSGTIEILNIPDQVGQLTRLRNLELKLYGPDFEREYSDLPSEFLSRGVIISKLLDLEALSIIVHPGDQRWKRIAGDITKEISGLKMLRHLEFYFPKLENLEDFIQTSSPWNENKLMTFKFIVGNNVKRICTDRVPKQVQWEFDKQERSLKFACCGEIPRAIEKVLERATAFYLDHHFQAHSLSQFGVSNFGQVKFCVLRECENLEVLIYDDDDDDDDVIIMPSLEYLGIHFLWKLQHIWKHPLPRGRRSFCALKYLTVVTCRKLQFVFSISMVQCLSNLEELLVEKCDAMTTIIEVGKEDETLKENVLPRLRKIELRYLFKLISLGSDHLLLTQEQIIVDCCPNLKLNLKLCTEEEQITVPHRPKSKLGKKFLGSLFGCFIK